MTAGGGGDHGGAADCGIKPPVPIVAVPEGVVGNGGADEERATEQAFAAAGSDLLDQREEAVVEADGVHDAGFPGGGGEFGGFGDINA